jgi:hypothetical protein
MKMLVNVEARLEEPVLLGGREGCGHHPLEALLGQ